jgi:hypothetical protein
MGSEPEIYFYADREAVTKHIITYGMMDSTAENMQKVYEMENDILTNKPLYIVMVKIPSSWILTVSNTQSIINWTDKQIQDNYELKGIVELLSPKKVNTVWDDDVKNFKNHGGNTTYIFRRRE